MAQRRESKFLRSQTPVWGSQNLHPNKFIPKILNKNVENNISKQNFTWRWRWREPRVRRRPQHCPLSSASLSTVSGGLAGIWPASGSSTVWMFLGQTNLIPLQWLRTLFHCKVPLTWTMILTMKILISLASYPKQTMKPSKTLKPSLTYWTNP